MNNNKSTRNTEAELLAGLKLERKFAFDQFYHLHSPALFTYLLKILNDADIADEILQEVFVKIWERGKCSIRKNRLVHICSASGKIWPLIISAGQSAIKHYRIVFIFTVKWPTM